jgi:hypothetical protein
VALPAGADDELADLLAQPPIQILIAHSQRANYSQRSSQTRESQNNLNRVHALPNNLCDGVPGNFGKPPRTRLRSQDSHDSKDVAVGLCFARTTSFSTTRSNQTNAQSTLTRNLSLKTIQKCRQSKLLLKASFAIFTEFIAEIRFIP